MKNIIKKILETYPGTDENKLIRELKKMGVCNAQMRILSNSKYERLELLINTYSSEKSLEWCMKNSFPPHKGEGCLVDILGKRGISSTKAVEEYSGMLCIHPYEILRDDDYQSAIELIDEVEHISTIPEILNNYNYDDWNGA